jgi:hypothetical protein
MPVTPAFLDTYIKDVATRQPDEDTTASGGELTLQSTWGFESPSNDRTKGWQLGNTLQLIEGARAWEISTSFVVPGDSDRIEKRGRLVPAFAGEQLESAMEEQGFGPSRWQDGPFLTFSQSLPPDATAPEEILEALREVGFAQR